MYARRQETDKRAVDRHKQLRKQCVAVCSCEVVGCGSAYLTPPIEKNRTVSLLASASATEGSSSSLTQMLPRSRVCTVLFRRSTELSTRAEDRVSVEQPRLCARLGKKAKQGAKQLLSVRTGCAVQQIPHELSKERQRAALIALLAPAAHQQRHCSAVPPRPTESGRRAFKRGRAQSSPNGMPDRSRDRRDGLTETAAATACISSSDTLQLPAFTCAMPVLARSDIAPARDADFSEFQVDHSGFKSHAGLGCEVLTLSTALNAGSCGIRGRRAQAAA